MPAFGLPGAARLKRRELIRPLFDRSRTDVSSVAHGCIRLVFRLVPRAETKLTVPVQVGFSPGRGIRRAVDRNAIKRYLREAFRLHQDVLAQPLLASPNSLTMMVLFRGKPEQARRCIPHDLPGALRKAARELPVQLDRNATPARAHRTE